MDKPNIVLINMDDMGWRDMACSGSTFYETPNIDQLCREGMFFKNAYASCPVCSPSRVSMMTGKYPARLGTTDYFDTGGKRHPLRGPLIDAPYINHLPAGETTIAQALKDGGYVTWHVGKWHMGKEAYYPEHFGFDKNIAGNDWGFPSQGYFAPYGIDTLAEGPEGEYLTDRITDEAIRLIESETRPFFLNLCHFAVHTPIQAKKEDIERFEEKAKRMKLTEIDALIIGEAQVTEQSKGYRIVRRVLQSDPVYAAMIWNLDWNIGRLMNVLKYSGKLERTVIVFTSDNGGLSTSEGSPTCNLPAREGKGWLNEGGIRIPLIVRYPREIRGGEICHTPVITPDIYPTLLELAGLPLRPEQHLDGVSLLPLFHCQEIQNRPLFWHYPHYGNQGGTPGSIIREGKYKLIQYFNDMHVELYDIENDLGEYMEQSEVHPEVVQILVQKLNNWQQEVFAKFPTPNPYYSGVQ